MAYKTTNVRYFDEAYQDSAPWEKYQPYHMSLSVAPNEQFQVNIDKRALKNACSRPTQNDTRTFDFIF